MALPSSLRSVAPASMPKGASFRHWVLALVPWARHSLAEYVRKHRPDLDSEVVASLEDLELADG